MATLHLLKVLTERLTSKACNSLSLGRMQACRIQVDMKLLKIASQRAFVEDCPLEKMRVGTEFDLPLITDSCNISTDSLMPTSYNIGAEIRKEIHCRLLL